MIKKIGILTSGGDAPGMNSAIVGAIKTAQKYNKEVYLFEYGYKGLCNGIYKKINKNFKLDFANRGGTILKSARYPEFKEEKTQKKAVNFLKKIGIDALIVIGGDGSYMGAKKLSEKGINCIGLPGTIDNDISSSDFTIGFDTCLNTVVNSIDAIKETIESHDRCGVIEIMGNKCGDLTLYAGIATNADVIITKENIVSFNDAIKQLKSLKKNGKKSAIVLISEKLYNSQELVSRIEKEVGYETRLTILGHIQRGGDPTAMERFNAMRMGAYAVTLLNKNIGGVCVGLVNNKLKYQDIYKALNQKRKNQKELYDFYNLVK